MLTSEQIDALEKSVVALKAQFDSVNAAVIALARTASSEYARGVEDAAKGIDGVCPNGDYNEGTGLPPLTFGDAIRRQLLTKQEWGRDGEA